MAALTTVALEPDGDLFTPELDRIEARIADLAPLWGVIYASFTVLSAQRFASEGPRWASLADSTVAERVRLGIGGSHPILDRTGASQRSTGRTRKTYGRQTRRTGGQLRRSLTTPGASNAIFRPGVDQVFMGTSDPVAEFHQNGTDRMPARPLVDVSEEDEAMWTEMAATYLFTGSLSVLGSASPIGPVGL